MDPAKISSYDLEGESFYDTFYANGVCTPTGNTNLPAGTLCESDEEVRACESHWCFSS